MKNKPRISGVTFTPVKDVRLKVSHAERTDLGGREHHLPDEFKLGNIVVHGEGQENAISALHIKREIGMTYQAKNKGARPFWEGVIVLPELLDANVYKEVNAKRLNEWCRVFEEKTGCKVLHACIHLDEGFLRGGVAHYNPHAHVLIDRTLKKGPLLWCPRRKDMADIQSMTAGVFDMPRGSTLKSRGGAFARKHTPPIAWRRQQELKSLLVEYVESLVREIQILKQKNKALLKGAKALREAYRSRGASLAPVIDKKTRQA